jgi:ABC-type uncharacterized transport system substrate-binding protein
MKKLFALSLFFLSFSAFSQVDKNTIMENVKKCFPTATKAGIFIDARKMSSKGSLTSACSSHGMTAIIVPLKAFNNVGPGFKQLTGNFNVDFIFVPKFQMSRSKKFRSFLTKKCGIKKVPLIVEDREFVKGGALMCFENQGGEVVAVINKKTASIIGFTPPADLKTEMIE